MRKKAVEKAKWFADYVRDPYNKDRDIHATLGSAGYIYQDDIKQLKKDLNEIGEAEIAVLL